MPISVATGLAKAGLEPASSASESPYREIRFKKNRLAVENGSMLPGFRPHLGLIYSKIADKNQRFSLFINEIVGFSQKKVKNWAQIDGFTRDINC